MKYETAPSEWYYWIGGIMKKYVLVFMLVILCGCGRVSVKPSEEIQHSYLKNYSLGELKTAYVGQPIVKARDYYADFKVTAGMKPTVDFVLTGIYRRTFPNYKVEVLGKKDVNYPASGSIILGEIEYSIVNMINEASKNKEEIGILVDRDGNIFSGNILDNDHDVKMILVSSDISPKNVTMLKDGSKKIIDENDIDLFACYTNYELIYGGINNVSLSMTYREFTIDDMAKPSFFQNIVYETNAKQIRFKDTLLDILEVTNEKIVYKVIKDGLIESSFPKSKLPKDYEECKESYERLNKYRRR
jgi:hypothetical protein